MEATITSTVYFGEFELDPVRRTLGKNGQIIPLNAKAFDLLLVLIEKAGAVVGKDELLERVWPDQFVEENNLTVHVAALRKALGEKKGEHRFIVTVPGRGYTFVTAVEQKRNGDRALVRTRDNEIVRSQSHSLIGRETEISKIKNLLGQDDVRLVTLTGTGGTGKTSLAQAVSAAMTEEFPDGVFFVELAAAGRPEHAAAAIAQSLGVAEAGGRSLIDSVRDFLSEKRALLILDNFEQILSAAPLVAELLARAASHKILITSRIALKLPAERAILVAPLETPPPDYAVSPDRPSEYAAVSLFIARAQMSRPGFSLNEKNACPIAEICRRLDGLPLAIELAAARVSLLSPAAILSRLENSLKLLTRAARDQLPARQQTMRSTIEWSYDLLEENEKTIFRRLAVFAGGFTVEAAEAVIENGATDPPVADETFPSALDGISSLLEKNLISAKEAPDGEIRLRMLEVVREFALEKLSAHGEADALRKDHAFYFLGLAEKAEPLLMGESSTEWLERLETEHDNLRAALDFSLVGEPETAARIAAALRYFWSNRSHLTEGRLWLESVLEKNLDENTTTYFKLLNGLGQFFRYKSDFDKARKLYEKLLANEKSAAHPAQVAIAYHGLAAIATQNGDMEAAQRLSEEELDICRKLNDETRTAFALASLGDLALIRNDAPAARPLIEESLDISRRLGNKTVTCVNLLNLGMVGFKCGEISGSAEHFSESLEIARELGNRTLISCVLDGFAAIAVKCGEFETAIKIAGSAENLRESIGYDQEPAERSFCATYIAKARAALDEKSFQSAYAEGINLSMNQAVALATASVSENTLEIVVETHKIERFVIEEEIEEE